MCCDFVLSILSSEVGGGDGGGGLGEGFGGAFEDDVATHGAAAGAELDEVVAGFQHLDVVLDEEDGVAGIHHCVEEFQDTLDVARMEAVGGLVHDKNK